MLLDALTLLNFRCFESATDIPIHRLTVFIGENDAGKTCLLEAIEFLLTSRLPQLSDFRKKSNGDIEETLIIEGRFVLEDFDHLPDDFRSDNGRIFILRKICTVNSARYEVEGKDFRDQRWSSFPRQSAQVQKELLQSLGIDPGSNGDQRTEQYSQAINASILVKESQKIVCKFNDISDYLPRFEKIASTDYHHPDAMVQRTFQAVVDSFIKPENPETHERELRADLRAVKEQIKQALDEKTAQMLETLQRACPKLQNIEVNPNIDFSRSVTTTNLMLDIGAGPLLISAYGEGTKKKLWMGLLDWEKQTQEELRDISRIRVYDEPDVNLDYAAERKLFANIIESTRVPDLRTQAIVCTHAVTLIDRAPGQSINLITVSNDGTREIHYLNCDFDDEVKSFLTSVSRSVGLSNSSLFYERAFLVVEGESEENALPILYRNLYGRSFLEDGIVLIPLYTCGAWKAVLNVLNHHKQEITLLLLDRDCNNPISSVHITPSSLAEIGYPSEFLEKNCLFIGNKEFEDAFATSEMIQVLNTNWPKESGATWVENEIDQFRGPDCKFSEDMLTYVRKNCIKSRRNATRKPDFAHALANHCQMENQIPETIREIFERLRYIAFV